MPPKFRVKELSLIGNELHQEGAIVELPEGTLPAENLEPLDEEGEALYQKYLESNAARQAQMHANNPASGVGDTNKFAEALAKSQEANAAMIGTAVASAVSAAFANIFPGGLPVPAQAAAAEPAPAPTNETAPATAPAKAGKNDKPSLV